MKYVLVWEAMKCCLLNWNLSGPIGEGGVLKWEPVHVSADEDCNPARFGNIQRNCQVVLTLSVPPATDTCSDKFTIFSHLHNIHTSSQYSHIFTIFTHLHTMQRINSVHFAQLHEFEFKMHEIMTKSVRVHCRILFPAFSPSINR